MPVVFELENVIVQPNDDVTRACINILKKCWRIAFHGTSLHSNSPLEGVLVSFKAVACELQCAAVFPHPFDFEGP